MIAPCLPCGLQRNDRELHRDARPVLADARNRKEIAMVVSTVASAHHLTIRGCRTAADLCSALAREMSDKKIAAAQREARFPHPALTWDMAAHRTNKRNPVALASTTASGLCRAQVPGDAGAHRRAGPRGSRRDHALFARRKSAPNSCASI